MASAPRRTGPRAIDGSALLAELFDPSGFVETSPGQLDSDRLSQQHARTSQTMPFRSTFNCLWCGDPHVVRRLDDLEGYAQLCSTCVGRAGDNGFLRMRLKRALAERAAASHEPDPAAAEASEAPDARRAGRATDSDPDADTKARR